MKNLVKVPTLSLPHYKKNKIKKLYDCTPKLSDPELIAIYCRYWENMTIEEISNVINLSWDATDKLIEAALTQLKFHFSNNTKPLAFVR